MTLGMYLQTAVAIIMWSAVFGLKRMTRVVELRNDILFMCLQYNVASAISGHYTEEQNANRWCYGKLPGEGAMLFSFKRLKLENWLSEETIKKLKSKNIAPVAGVPAFMEN